MQGRERIPLHNRQKNPHGTPVRLAVAFRSTRLRSNHRSSFINAQLALPDHTTALRLLNPPLESRILDRQVFEGSRLMMPILARQ